MKYPYEFVDQILQDFEDWQLAAQLYCFSGKIHRENLMEFCESKNGEFPDVPLYKLMLFDERQNAVFPAFIQDMRLDEWPNHLRAIYTYNHSEHTGNLDVLSNVHAGTTKNLAI